MNDLSCGISMWAQVFFVFSQSTRLTDRQTDGRTERSWQYRALQHMQSHGKTYNRSTETLILSVLPTGTKYGQKTRIRN